MLGSARSVLMKTSAPAVTLPTAYAAYNFNENTGTVATDSSGGGHNLTVANATWVAGHTGSALSNTTATDGASSSTLTVPTATISYMAWIKPLQLTANATNLAFGFFNGGSTRAAIFTQRGDFPPNNVLQADLFVNGNLSAVGGNALTLNTWTHVAVTYDGSVIKLYQDGTLLTTSGVTVGAIGSSSVFYVAGGNSLNTQVVVDDLRIFNTALSAAQITVAMNTPVS
jgi:hypothetical protein